MNVEGVCAPEFDEIKTIFENYFNQQIEHGANFTVVKQGSVLINIFGGSKNNQKKWDEDTIVNTFSLSKGIYAACIAKLINEAQIDIEKNISYYWPEFQHDIKVKYLLSHQSGFYRFKTKLDNKDLLNFEKITDCLISQSADHGPGLETYYHAKTHGYLVENLIRKITNMTLKEYFKEYFQTKYNLNFCFGFEEKDFENVADLIEDKKNKQDNNSEFNAFNNPEHDVMFYNTKEWRLAGVPSMGGHGSALAVAKLYDILANDLMLDNNKIIRKNKFEEILTQTDSKMDNSLKLPIRWTYSGFILRGGWMFGKNKENFGHNGWGGSLGFGDPVHGLGISYVTRKINSGMGADMRALNLIKKFYELI